LSDLIPVLIAAAKEVAQNSNDQKAKQKLFELKVSFKLDMLQCNWFLKMMYRSEPEVNCLM
jgi:hypothetical protein